MTLLDDTRIIINTPEKLEIQKAGTEGLILFTILDASGSMGSIAKDTIGGYNIMIESQKEPRTEVNLLVFSGNSINFIDKNSPISEAKKLDSGNYRPMGGTNLLDAIGEGINEANKRLDSITGDRPGVLINIITDGEENTSIKYNNDDIKRLVSECEENGWGFAFLGANIDSFSVGAKMGFTANNTMNWSSCAVMDTMDSVGAYTTRMAAGRSRGLTGEALYAAAAFTDEERMKSNGK